MDHFLGTGAYAEIAEDRLATRRRGGSSIPDPDFVHTASTPAGQLAALAHRLPQGRPRAATRTCAFCIIPKLRGPQRSRAIDDVVARGASARRAGDRGAVARRAGPDRVRRRPPRHRSRLHDLLRELVPRSTGSAGSGSTTPTRATSPTRSSTSSRREPKIVKYLDMPLQHASERILKAMRRGGSAKSMRALLAKLRRRIPGVALRTSLIVGLPGETEADFRELLAFVKEQRVRAARRLRVLARGGDRGRADAPGRSRRR